LISDFRRDLNIVYFLLGISPASNCSCPTFRNLVSVPFSKALKMELIQGSETSANYNLTPGKYPKENIQNKVFPFFTHIPCILILSKFLYSPTDAQVNCLKNYFKIHIKIDIKTSPTCFGAVTPSSGSALLVLARVMRSLMMV